MNVITHFFVIVFKNMDGVKQRKKLPDESSYTRMIDGFFITKVPCVVSYANIFPLSCVARTLNSMRGTPAGVGPRDKIIQLGEVLSLPVFLRTYFIC
ncbi:hypothetical protein MAR_017665 [Mya arenaria]|uniref:Uncharacterized protein n=1 Tax=Mya arenaria TaxID=6604 RepID=A0ABY7EFW7_MYAAR|nr:hypothetical protein MAR_017665 [Mya arenaria]